MKLYNMFLSNFASKCRLAIYEKGVPVDIVPIPGGDLKSPEYLTLYPLGKTPLLDANGLLIGESEVINEYLEDKFPQPALLPKDPEGRARSRILSRFHDLYLEPPLRAMFGQVNPATRDQKLVDEKLAETHTRIEQLETMISTGPYATGSAFTLADCALVPTMFYATLLAPMLGSPPALDGRPKLATWWAKAQERASVQQVLREQQEALMRFQQTGKGS